MAEPEKVRVEIAFESGQIIAASVSAAAADELEAAIAEGGGPVQAETEDGRITVVASRVTYMKRHRRESSIGFGT